MWFPFRELKATQAAAFFLKKEGGAMSYLKLMKLLYITERTALCEWGFAVVGGRYCSMEHGPVISPVLDLIKKADDLEGPSTWTNHLSREGYDLKLGEDPGDAELSDAEVDLMQRVYDQYGHLTKWEIRDLTHDFPEWKSPGKSSLPLDIADILVQQNKSSDRVKSVHADAKAAFEMSQVFPA